MPSGPLARRAKRWPALKAPDFAVGDPVQFFPCGPVMHVIAVSTHHCHCHWVDPYGKLQQGTFEQGALMRARLEPPAEQRDP